MAVDVSAQGAFDRRQKLQSRLSQTFLSEFKSSVTADDFWRLIRKYLLNASTQGLIEESPEKVRDLVLISVGGHPDIERSTHSIAIGDRARNFKHEPDFPSLTRSCDGARFNFQISVCDENRVLEVLAYGFELTMPSGGEAPFSFVRFDLTADSTDDEDGETSKTEQGKKKETKKKDNVLRALRSHIHLNSDDDGYSIPSVMLSPFEALDMMIHYIRAPEDGRRR